MVDEPANNKNSSPQIELRCTVDRAMLGPLRAFVCNIARELGFTEQQVCEIEICVDEVCANCMEHAYSKTFEREFPNTSRDLFMEVHYRGDEMTVRIIDHGIGTDAKCLPRISHIEDYLEKGRENFRGLGLYLIRKFMDRVDFHSAPGKGTTVVMTKYRR